MQNYQATPDYYRDYIQHMSPVGELIRLIGPSIYNYRRKKKGLKPVNIDTRSLAERLVEEGGKKGLGYVYKKAKPGDNQAPPTLKPVNKKHKYIKKYMGKSGKWVYQYYRNSKGLSKTKTPRMIAN